MYYNAADYARLIAVKGLVKNWQVQFPSTGVAAKIATAPGFLDKIGTIDVTPDKDVEYKFSIKLTDDITITTAS
ncbi:hypothetical protein FRUB_07008 [Fimbriiglobus ruber]|uniref:Uncharacterized protein n=2 Tax=Fimbriiglobus ruber TaxID=1908690 RepID=A0A225DH65_9BACT|nr:hypothetical protein FRUB_07008 [Fimbriiglobus ruber]